MFDRSIDVGKKKILRCWGLALRKTMLRAHRQAWAWQDEWHGLTMEDIREIERQTQLALKRKMGQVDEEIGELAFFRLDRGRS